MKDYNAYTSIDNTIHDEQLLKETSNEEPRKERKGKSSTTRETTEPETVITGTIYNSKFVNVRRDPSLVSESVAILEQGERFRILDKNAIQNESASVKFYKIQLRGGTIGYISSDFCKEE